MDDPALVGVLHRQRDQLHQLQDLPLRKPARAGVVIERLALDQLHCVVVVTVPEAAVVDAGDVRVFELGGALDFAIEAKPGPFAEGTTAQELERDVSTRRDLHGPPDGPHPPFTQSAGNAIPGDVWNAAGRA